jgi:hypothetical protein
MSTPNQEKKMDTAFETKPCTRCGGSGHYSYCQSHGTRCFGCNGRGWQFTKRGAAAYQMYSDSLHIPASDVVVGQKIRIPGVPGISGTVWMLVTGITADVHRSKSGGATEWTETPAVRFSGQIRKFGSDWTNTEDYGYGLSADAPVRVEHTHDEKRAKIAAAVAYQEMLTKQGTPRQRAATPPRTAWEVSHAANLARRARGETLS